MPKAVRLYDYITWDGTNASEIEDAGMLMSYTAISASSTVELDGSLSLEVQMGTGPFNTSIPEGGTLVYENVYQPNINIGMSSVQFADRYQPVEE